MKIVLLASGEVGSQVAKYLATKKESIACLGIHSKERKNHKQKIKRYLKMNRNKVIILSKKISKEKLKKIRAVKPDYILVIFWPHLLPENLIGAAKKGCINLHIGYLPYNRGKNANVWPIINQTPAGVSMHFIDKSIDGGRVVSQIKVKTYITDDGKTLYDRLIKNCLPLFKKTWKKIKENKLRCKKQRLSKGSIHYSKDFKKLNCINLNKKVYPLDLFNQLRAKKFLPFPLPYFFYKGKKVEIDLNLKLKS